MAASGRAGGPDVIWALPERTGRGPRPAYTRDDIAEAAVRIADEAGMDAVSMRRVAAAVGCGTMSLYNYVPRKEDLVDLMVDRVSGEYELPEKPSGDWQADILALARQGRTLMHRHPWLPAAVLPTAALGPNGLRYMEFCLAALEGSGLDDGLKIELIGMVNGAVISYVSSELATARQRKDSAHTAEQRQAAQTAYLARILAGGDYPHLSRTFTAAPAAGDPDETFDRLLGRVLAGYAAAC
ncbi:TetR/AcrR family transcriptional regulator [Streptomyces coffeae]|uniref:TetR/AcrR family transcriptional regulator C-terminal domain-containing protein n=1 Tax=Streptomyces coffeae TaxID=621382 RepID=A0ABS1NJ27_9ACTN|nr:TetR/AcrR family transcriptional regulator [Streptomyces coffeae]MBL1099776.1 TetR/AcrR family transcriptional regulator C-terminal domain-containing protein [Streptomyces coffeae]